MTLTVPDFVNGIFEAGIGLFQWVNVSVIRRDREVRGIHWSITAWTSLWGIYNLYYYPHLHQWLSFTGGCVIAAANIVWVTHAMFYHGDLKWRPPFVPPRKTVYENSFLVDPFGKKVQ